MGKIIGRQVNVGIGKEITRGTAVTPTFWLKYSTADYDDKIEMAQTEQSLGVIEDTDEGVIVQKFSEGKVEGNVFDKSIGLILMSVFGGLTSAVKETTAYNHTITVAQTATHQALTIDIKNGSNEQLAFTNCMIKSFELKYDPLDFVKYSAEFKGKKGVTSTTTPSYSAENYFIGKHGIFKIATDLSGLTGASAIVVKALTLKIEKVLISDDVIGSLDPADIYNGGIAVSGNVELIYNDTTYKALALAGTQKAMRIDIQNTDQTIGSSSNPGLQIDLAKAKFTEYSLKRDLKGIITQSLDFKAFYSLTDSKMITALLTNNTVSY